MQSPIYFSTLYTGVTIETFFTFYQINDLKIEVLIRIRILSITIITAKTITLDNKYGRTSNSPPRNVQIIKGNLTKTAFRKQINRKGT